MSSQHYQPQVSIIIPAHNYARFLNETLSCVQRQTFSNWECLIVDDGSTDDTREVTLAWTNRDARFRYLHQENRGLCAARNAGIENTRGDWLQFLDADDLISRHKLAKELALAREYSHADMLGGRFVFMTHDGSSFWQWSQVRSRLRTPDAFGDLLAAWEKGLMFTVHALLFRRECFERWGHWDETLITHEDWELYLRFTAGGAQIICHEEVVAAYRKHHGSAASDATKMRRGFLIVMLKLLESPFVARRYKALAALRFIEDCFKSVVLKLQGRRIELKAVYFDCNSSSSYRAWLLAVFVLGFPALTICKIGDMLRVRARRARGDYQRLDFSSFE